MRPTNSALVGLVALASLGQVACLVRPSQAEQQEEGGGAKSASGVSSEGSRPSRGGGGVFDEPEADAATTDDGVTTEAADTGVDSEASAEWQTATAGIASDMRAHLKRRQKKADADLIVQNRNPITKVIFGIGDFLRSRYFANVRKSIGIFIGFWLWYVLNTKTYEPPEVEE